MFLNGRVSSRSYPLPTPAMLLRAYAAGIFPMAESAASSDLRWFDPPVRALIPLDSRFHISRRLVRKLRHNPYRVTLNRAFQDVMQGCAEPQQGRETTWINQEILRLYTTLHQRGHAHAIEVWEDDELVGGLYGVSLGSAFFGESMFSRKKDASKIALVHLVALLRNYGYTLLDTQFQTPHLGRFGTFEVERDTYLAMLNTVINTQAVSFPNNPAWDHLLAGILSLQPVTQIS